ncbi:hypothetical protein [Aquimarina latercula]|uniref:hypothetical protein n=1 Tax=Aquimarina latercula TaxID=987 RepID=UPI00040A1B9E|nr:hypothetical protein [Aquimarina latercula]
MKYKKSKFRDFLINNGISTYFLHRSIKNKITTYENQMHPQVSKKNIKSVYQGYEQKLIQEDIEILRSIKEHLIKRVVKSANNDLEILKVLKKIKWTTDIKESELRAMGLESPLFWNTTIFGKLKLVRIHDLGTRYYIVPIARRLKIKELLNSIRLSKKPVVAFEK